MHSREGNVNDLELYHRIWTAKSSKTRGGLLFLHGHTDHISRFDEALQTLSDECDILILGYDSRGFGQSAKVWSKLGVTGGWVRQLGDIDEATLLLKKFVGPDKPLFLSGHSMGGGLTLKYGFDGKYTKFYSGFIAIAPLINLSSETRPNRAIRFLAEKMYNIFPRFPLPNTINVNYITRNQEEIEKLKRDPWIGRIGTLKGVADMVLGGEAILKNASKFNRPVLIQHGSNDKITDHDSSKKFIETCSSKDKQFLSYAEAYHNLFDEVYEVKKQVINDYIGWLKDRL